MTQTNVARFYLLLFGGIFFLTSCINLMRFYPRDDIWWTPATSPLSLEQSRDRVEVYVRGVPLQSALQSGRLQLAGDSGLAPITANDIRIRLNNYDRVKVERLPLMLSSAAGAGFTGLILLLGATGWVPFRPRRSGAPGPSETGTG